jgi:putative ABC transport system permease protein
LPLARQVRRLDLVRDLRQSERGLGSRSRRRLLDGLVAGQLATSVALLFAAGILLRTFVDMTAIKPGFDPRNVLTFNVALSPVRYATPERQSAFCRALFDSLRAVRGVKDVGWGMFAPLGGGGWGDSFVREGTDDAPPNLPFMQLKMVSPEYASTLRIPLIAGRSLARAGRIGAPDVALVNATLAAACYGGANPVGKHITFQKRSLEIVGVIGDSRNQSLWTTPTDDRVRRSMAPERFRAILIGTLAALALLLSVLGIYGLVAWVVGRRTREIGIRMALGEDASRVRRRVLGDAIRLGLSGITLGALASVASARYLQAFIAGDVRPRDPLTLLATMALLLAFTAAAAWFPARRASKVDPLLAIRAE